MIASDLVAAVVLGGLAALVLGGMAYSIRVWSRRRRDVRRVAASAGFSVVDDPTAPASSGLLEFREFQAAVPGRPGSGRFENVLCRRQGDVTILVFDYAAGSSAGDALLPWGTYACVLSAAPALPHVRVTPRPAPRSASLDRVLKQPWPELEVIELRSPGGIADDFAARYAIEAESRQAVDRFLTHDKLEFLARASPPWFVEAGPPGMALALRPGSDGLRRFQTVPPDRIPAFAQAAERTYDVLAKPAVRTRE